MRTNSASSVFGRECPPCNPNYYLTPEVNQLAINACVRDRRADDSRPNHPAWVVWLTGVQYTRIVLSREACSTYRELWRQMRGFLRIEHVGSPGGESPPWNRDAIPPAHTGVAHGRGILSSAAR